MSLIDSYLSLHNKSKNLATKSILNTFFDKIVVINLRRSVARLAKVTKQLRTLGIQYEIFNAIDGSSPNIRKDYEQYLQNRKEIEDLENLRESEDLKGLVEASEDPHNIVKNAKNIKNVVKRPGEYAYLLTWIKLLKKGIREGWHKLLVFEDDVLLCDDFSNRVTKWLTCDVPKNAVVWLLGATQLPHLRGTINYDRNYFRPGLTDGSFAIGLDAEVFPFLRFQIEKMDGPLDSGPLRAVYKKYKDRCYAAFPYLVIAEVKDSTIRSPKDLQKVAEKLEWNLNDFSVCKKNQNLKVAVTLYLKSENLVSAIKDLIDESTIIWSIFLIFGVKKEENDTLQKKLEELACKNVSFFIYPNVVKSLKMAEQLSEQHWSSIQSIKTFDCVVFYDLALKLDENVLHSISTFF